MKNISTKTLCRISIGLSIYTIIINVLANLDKIISFLRFLRRY